MTGLKQGQMVELSCLLALVGIDKAADAGWVKNGELLMR